MASEEVNIDRELIKAQASGEWQKHDYRTLRYVGYAAVEATIEAAVSDGQFVWSWSVVTKDKAMPFAGHAPTLDKAIKDAQWHIEQVASVEHQVDVFSGVPSSPPNNANNLSAQTTSPQINSCSSYQGHLVEHPRKGIRTSSRRRELTVLATRANIQCVIRAIFVVVLIPWDFILPSGDLLCLQKR